MIALHGLKRGNCYYTKSTCQLSAITDCTLHDTTLVTQASDSEHDRSSNLGIMIIFVLVS